MKNNSLLTYVLYGLLGLIIVISGYYACQKQKEQKLKQEQDEAELQQTLRNMGYSPDTAAVGSSFAGEDTSKVKTPATKPAVDKNGIEKEPETKATVAVPKTTAPSTGTQTTAKPTAPTTTKSTTTTTKPTATTTKTVKGPGTGRWAVRAGTFSYMDGARRRLEEVIKAGYPNAEISKTSDGKAAVVVFRSNDKNAAIRVVDVLEGKGIDAAVFDRKQ